MVSIDVNRGNAIANTQCGAPPPGAATRSEGQRLALQDNAMCADNTGRSRTAWDQFGKHVIKVATPCAAPLKTAELAWTLAEEAKPFLTTAERNHVYVTVGVGETFAAFRALISFIATKRIAVSLDLIEQCTRSLDAYIGHEEEPDLRWLIERVRVRGESPTTTCMHHEPERLRSDHARQAISRHRE